MGDEPGPVVVADAGPLIHLHEIGRLPLLAVFSAVHIPQGVCDELMRSRRVPDDELNAALTLQCYQVAPEQVAQAASKSRQRMEFAFAAREQRMEVSCETAEAEV